MLLTIPVLCTKRFVWKALQLLLQLQLSLLPANTLHIACVHHTTVQSRSSGCTVQSCGLAETLVVEHTLQLDTMTSSPIKSA